MKQLLNEDNSQQQQPSSLDNIVVVKRQDTSQSEIPEVTQLLDFVTQIEQLWASLLTSEHKHLLKMPTSVHGTSTENITNSPDKATKRSSQAFPAELSSKLTH